MGAAIIFGLVRTLQWAAYFHLLGSESFCAPALYSRVLGYNNLFIALSSDFVPYMFTSLLVRSPSSSHASYYFTVKLLVLVVFIASSAAFCVCLTRSERARPAPLPYGTSNA